MYQPMTRTTQFAESSGLCEGRLKGQTGLSPGQSHVQMAYGEYSTEGVIAPGPDRRQMSAERVGTQFCQTRIARHSPTEDSSTKGRKEERR